MNHPSDKPQRVVQKLAGRTEHTQRRIVDLTPNTRSFTRIAYRREGCVSLRWRKDAIRQVLFGASGNRPSRIGASGSVRKMARTNHHATLEEGGKNCRNR